ncbi:hypothetical protein [Acuticoccus sediminis]|nr:hypothetical protein [Acuticoccus sediminis]
MSSAIVVLALTGASAQTNTTVKDASEATNEMTGHNTDRVSPNRAVDGTRGAAQTQALDAQGAPTVPDPNRTTTSEGENTRVDPNVAADPNQPVRPGMNEPSGNLDAMGSPTTEDETASTTGEGDLNRVKPN